jgi:hypothetical protein
VPDPLDSGPSTLNPEQVSCILNPIIIVIKQIPELCKNEQVRLLDYEKFGRGSQPVERFSHLAATQRMQYHPPGPPDGPR